MNQILYVLGEAYYVGEELHIGTPSEENKPFLISTKSEDDLVKGYKSNAVFTLFGGIATIAGFGTIIYKIVGK